MDALMDLIGDLREARTSGATDEQIAEARKLQRKAQFLLDFAEAENSSGFHAPQEGSPRARPLPRPRAPRLPIPSPPTRASAGPCARGPGGSP